MNYIIWKEMEYNGQIPLSSTRLTYAMQIKPRVVKLSPTFEVVLLPSKLTIFIFLAY